MIRLGLEVSNFNHKTLNQEFLLEPYSLTYFTTQEQPLGQRVTKLKSGDMLNVNVTYGCLLSLNKALQEMKEEFKSKQA